MWIGQGTWLSNLHSDIPASGMQRLFFWPPPREKNSGAIMCSSTGIRGPQHTICQCQDGRNINTTNCFALTCVPYDLSRNRLVASGKLHCGGTLCPGNRGREPRGESMSLTFSPRRAKKAQTGAEKLNPGFCFWLGYAC